jgi:cytochrome P450
MDSKRKANGPSSAENDDRGFKRRRLTVSPGLTPRKLRVLYARIRRITQFQTP